MYVACVSYSHSLQKFKLNIANTIITQDNSSLRSMNTAELLDLFQLSPDSIAGASLTGDTVRHCIQSLRATDILSYVDTISLLTPLLFASFILPTLFIPKSKVGPYVCDCTCTLVSIWMHMNCME